MSHFTQQEFLTATGGQLVTREVAFEQPARLWTDTRTLQANDFFLPLKGANFDGHSYLKQAIEAGAVGAFVAEAQFRQNISQWSKLPNLIAVPDPLIAYLTMARYHRDKIDPIVVAVTGSSGKTTTKEMLYAAFNGLQKTYKTEKNFNNEVGVSQTLLAIDPDTRILIVEMGMRGLRQISLLSEYAKPDIAVVINVGPAHIGLLGSLENIATAKLEIVEGMNPQHGVLVINGDDPLLSRKAPEVWKGRTEAYHLSEAKDMQPVFDEWHEGVSFTYKHHEVKLSVPGEHHVANALAVLKAGEAMGFEIAELAMGLSRYQPEKGRWEQVPLEGYRDVWVINDAYNANPDSILASLKTFVGNTRLEKKRILILGGMKELGDFSRQYHEELGLWLGGQTEIDMLFTVGEEGQWIAEAAAKAAYPVVAAESAEEVVSALLREHETGTLPLEEAVILLKGSRAYNLDMIPAALTEKRKETASS